MVWKKYKNHNTNSGYDNDGLRREDSCDAVKSSSFMQSAEEVNKPFCFSILKKKHFFNHLNVFSVIICPRIRNKLKRNSLGTGYYTKIYLRESEPTIIIIKKVPLKKSKIILVL